MAAWEWAADLRILGRDPCTWLLSKRMSEQGILKEHERFVRQVDGWEENEEL
jgi:hypothetical protein